MRTTMLVAMLTTGAVQAAPDYPIQPVPFTRVHLEDGFWTPRLETNRAVTVRYDFDKCEETHRIDNFAVAGKLREGAFQGIPFNDSDVYKVIEGAAYTLAQYPDPELDRYLDGLIAKIAAAQEADGYLYSARSAGHVDGFTGPERWSNLPTNHELYNVGHLYEAAAAHFEATGKRSLLEVALKNADLIDRVFGPGSEQLQEVPGHQEIEMGLVKLYRVTGARKYLDLARFFLDERGQADRHALRGPYQQDHRPVTEQAEAVGHAVRAAYMYAGMADVAALTGDDAYLRAIDALWEDVVQRKLYLTGGIGAERHGEAFGAAFHLPNAEAYAETCAAIANALWNHRMFLLHGDAKYIDVLERTVYNGFLAGVSLQGNTFFYPNPLAADGNQRFNQGEAERAPWFGCSCCPVNVVRFIPSLPGMQYAVKDRSLYVNLFAGGTAEVDVAGSKVKVRQETRYPWDGQIRITVAPGQPADFRLAVRIPGWALGRPVPSDLYRYLEETPPYTLKVNGRSIQAQMERGFAVLDRTWKDGDQVELGLSMPVYRVVADERVEADRGRGALERGPLVYCIEGADHDGAVQQLVLPDAAVLEPRPAPDQLGGIVVLKGAGQAVERTDDGGIRTEAAPLTAIPYYAWCHRGANPMAVWIPRTPGTAVPLPRPTLASRSRVSASHLNANDSLSAVQDQAEPASSNDQTLPRMTWWDHLGTREWIQYDLPEAVELSGVEVYWFDDTGQGQCRVPASWTLSAKAGDGWKPVEAHGPHGTRPDTFNRLDFDPVETGALRIEVHLQDGFSGGILEWKLLP